MNIKEKLVELIRDAHKKCKAKKTCHDCEQYGNGSDCVFLFTSDYLIAHGVTVQEDVVEVVRCKNCKYYDEKTRVCEEFTSKKLPTGGHVAFLMKPDDFCSYGERRNDNVNG